MSQGSLKLVRKNNSLPGNEKTRSVGNSDEAKRRCEYRTKTSRQISPKYRWNLSVRSLGCDRSRLWLLFWLWLRYWLIVMVMVKVTDICIVTERNKNTMIDIKQIKALSMREAEITETLTFAKKELDKTGSAVLPSSLYHAPCKERKHTREQLEQMMK